MLGTVRVSCSGRPDSAGVEELLAALHAKHGRLRQRDAERVEREGESRECGSCRWTASRPSATTSGLSAALFNSSSTWSRADRSAASAAPCTCVTQRSDSGSCTRRAAPGCHSALPASSVVNRAAISDLSGRGMRRLHARVERAQVGAKAFERQRRGDVQRIQRVRAVVHHQRRVPDGRGVRADQRKAVLGRRAHRLQAGPRSAAAPAAPRRDTPRSPGRSAAGRDATAGARSATPIEPRLGTTGCTPAFSMRDERVEHAGRNAGAAHRHAGGAREHHRAHHIGREARADADGARLHGALLVGGEIVRGDRLAGIGAQRGIDAVDRRAGLRERSTTARAAVTRARAAAIERDRCSGAGHAHDVGDRARPCRPAKIVGVVMRAR